MTYVNRVYLLITQCSTQLLKSIDRFFFRISEIFQFFREWNKWMKYEPVSSVSLQRNKDWSWTVIQGLYNLDSLLFLCFMTFFYFWNTKSGLLVGGAPNFSRGKLFLFKHKGHAESRVPVILHLIQVEVFREISDWECCKYYVRVWISKFSWGGFPQTTPSPKKLASPARVFRGSPQLKLRSAVPANDSLWVFPKKSKSWWWPSLWSRNSLLAVPRPQ